MSDQVVQGYESVLSEMDELAVAAVGKQTAALFEKDKPLALLSGVLINSQQIYALARYRLHEMLAAHGVEWESGVEEFILVQMREKANEEFTRQQVREGMDLTAAYIVNELDMEREERKSANKKVLAEMEQERAAMEVPFLDQSIKRGEVLILVGKRESLQKRVTEEMVRLEDSQRGADDEKISTIRLLDHGKRNELRKKGSDPLSYEQVGYNHWGKHAGSPAYFDKFMSMFMTKIHGQHCDLLIVDDGYLTVAEQLSGRDPMNTIEDNLKLYRRWADGAHAAIICLALCPRGDDMAVFTDRVMCKFAEHHNIMVMDEDDYEE